MYHGYAGAETRALSAFEVALWDIMGKHYDAPLYHLLGGKTREEILPTILAWVLAIFWTIRLGTKTRANWRKACSTMKSTP